MFGSETLLNALSIAGLVFAVGILALWLSLIVWTFRDIRRRSRDLFAQILSVLIVALIPFLGLAIYFILRPPETLSENLERMLAEEALLQGIEAYQKCPGCSRVVQDDWQACPYCHVRLKVPCVNCSRLIDEQWSICPYCTAAQSSNVTEEGSLIDHV
ncbi:MAG: zinc ribbon domain-containing protein [Chloroflexota bacterium]